MRTRTSLLLCVVLALVAIAAIATTSQAEPVPIRPQPVSVVYGGPTSPDLRVVLERAVFQYDQDQGAMAAIVMAAEKQAVRPIVPRRIPAEAVYGTGACGGDLPPCSVMMCESGGNLTAQNPRSTASGKWQILDSTWRIEDTNGDGVNDSYQGYSRAMDAPEGVQDDRAREIYAGGAGRRAWVC